MNDNLLSAPEMQTGKVYIDPATGTQHRIFRKMINTGALPNATVKNVPHSIAGISLGRFISLQLFASNGTKARSYTSSDLAVEVDDTNVILTTAANLSAFTTSQVILEYTKQ